jgi:hypothetical protein
MLWITRDLTIDETTSRWATSASSAGRAERQQLATATQLRFDTRRAGQSFFHNHEFSI